MKNFFCIVLLAFIFQPAFADTLSVRKNGLIGPPVLVLPPPVDSALLNRLLVSERLKKKVTEQVDFKNRQNIIILNTILLKTETAVEPDANLIGTLEEALTEYIRVRDLKSQALVYTTYGVYYGRYGQREKAIDNFNEALRLREILKDNPGIAKISQNLMAIYKTDQQYDQAIKYAGQFITASLSQNKTAAAAQAYLDIAWIKFQQKKFKESENLILRKAFPLFRRTGNKWGRMSCFQNLAELYFYQKRYSEAKWFFIQSQIMAAKLADNQAMITSLTGLGKVKNALGEHADALKDYKQAEQLALRNNYLVKLVEINADLGDMYSQLGDYPAAGAALDKYSRFRESWIKTNKL